ncbi:MAG: hypothetical protein K6V73_09980 [Firmicutes bacterium]|nr:hypothetical protein [Bacillota bacterium]
MSVDSQRRLARLLRLAVPVPRGQGVGAVAPASAGVEVHLSGHALVLRRAQACMLCGRPVDREGGRVCAACREALAQRLGAGRPQRSQGR